MGIACTEPALDPSAKSQSCTESRKMFWSKTGGEFGQRRRSAGAAEGTELLQALFVQLSAAADAVLSSPLGWPTRYSHIYRLEKRRAE